MLYPTSVSGKTITLSASEKADPTLNGGNRFSAMPGSVANGVYETGNLISDYDLLKFPAAAALPMRGNQQGGYRTEKQRIPRHVILETPPSSSPSPPIAEDVESEKPDFSCIEKRQHISLANVFRQMGNTFSNPVTELFRESQVIEYWNKYKRCPSEEDIERLRFITAIADKAISTILSLLPGGQAVVVTQSMGGPLFRLIADTIDQEELNTADTLELNNAMLGVAKAVVDFSPKTADGKVIDSKLTLPEGLSFKNKKIFVNINGKEERLLYKENEFLANFAGKVSKISYSPKNKKWFIMPDKDHYIEPLSLTQHNYGAFSNAQRNIMNEINMDEKVQLYSYYHLPTNNPIYYGTGKIIDINSGNFQGWFVEMGGHYIPIRTTPHKLQGELLEIYDQENPDRKGFPIEWDGKRWVFEKETSVHVDKSLEKLITQKAFAKDIDTSQLSAPDKMGIRIDTFGYKYIKIRNNFVRLFEKNDNHFIIKDGRNQYTVKFSDDVLTFTGVKDDMLTEFDEGFLRRCGLLPRAKRSPCVHSPAESHHLDYLRYKLDPQENPVSTAITDPQDAIERLRPFYKDEYINDAGEGPGRDLSALISHYNGEGLYNKMHFSEVFAIFAYREGGIAKINKEMLLPTGNPELKKIINHLELSVRYLSEIQSTDRNMINLYGIALKRHANMNLVRKGKIGYHDGFYITTNNERALESFVSLDPHSIPPGMVKVVYKIEEAFPFSGVKLGDIGNNMAAQYLFLPHIKFQVTGIRHVPERSLFEVNVKQLPVSYEDFSSRLTDLVMMHRSPGTVANA